MFELEFLFDEKNRLPKIQYRKNSGRYILQILKHLIFSKFKKKNPMFLAPCPWLHCFPLFRENVVPIFNVV